jgi:hypothetical protein
MKEQSNEVKALRGAVARAALAVFTFVALTAWPLLADVQLGEQAQIHVARVTEEGNSSIQEDTSCRT